MTINYSVIIPTFNRARSLVRTLDSIVRQIAVFESGEVIVVDDGSTDDTNKVVGEFQRSNPNLKLRYVFQENGGPGKARNRGVKEAKGEIIFFTDDDCVVPEDWMERILNGYKKYPDAAGIGGWYVAPENETRFFQRTANLFNIVLRKDFMDKEFLLKDFRIPAACANVSYTKKILEEVGGFDESCDMLEDAELKYRIIHVYRKKIFVLPVFVSHYCTLTAGAYLKKLFLHGRWSNYFLRKHFAGSPPEALRIDIWRAPLRFFRLVRRFYSLGEFSTSDFIKITIFSALAVFLNAAGVFAGKFNGFIKRRNSAL